MPDELDAAAERVRRELIEIAVDQISKPIAHEFDIRIVLDHVGRRHPERPGRGLVAVGAAGAHPGTRGRAAGRRRTRRRARGRQSPLEVDVADADPVISEHLHHLLSDFVATCIASALAQLNAEMQRRLGRP